MVKKPWLMMFTEAYPMNRTIDSMWSLNNKTMIPMCLCDSMLKR